MKGFLLHPDCRFEAMYKNHQCWSRLHTNQIKIQFLIDQTFASEITHEIHIQYDPFQLNPIIIILFIVFR